MRCPFCGIGDSKVIDSRSADEGNTIRRRRECSNCCKRFTTYEVIEQIPLMVIKKDGRRVVFDKNKILNGIIRSCEKRANSMESITMLADRIEKELRNTMDREIPSKVIGELVMKHLKEFDQVAYVRFASVYRKFADINHFMQELETLMKMKKSRE
ncbi:transcriptional regulator NrdR [Anaerosinus massiliensis]|uniref:transcriptional regulator NrdR n=1 Tax=Massilibacillus massiliensis TaxID=1806837 RepID=UPI000AA51D88|nr:transcriptional regulator NrdR [Massilibacillus massiliensis]